MEAKQQREVKAIASARAEKTIRLYEEAVNYCKAEEERREAEKKEKEEARIKAEEARIVAEKREAEERERRRIQEEKELALRKAKQKRYLKIAGICVGVCVILIVGIISYNKYTIKNKYAAGIALMEQGEYEDAIEKFQTISGYNDADKLLKECTDQKNLADAKKAEENNDADEAQQYYNQLNDEIVNASKYEYIIAHKDSSDTITERYINDLWERQYESEKIAVLINEIYPITVNMVFNKTEDDESTNLESAIIKNSTDYICFHMIVEGGLAQHEYRLKLAMSTDLKKDIHTQQFSGSLPADLTDFIEKLDTNSMAIWGFSRSDYVEMELVDQDSDEVLKTAKMKLTYQ